MSDRNNNYKCPKCGSSLTWADTLSTAVDLEREEYRIREIYCCFDCNSDYNLFLTGEVKTVQEKWTEA